MFILVRGFLLNVQVSHQPRFDHLPFEAPLIAYTKGWKLLLGNQAVDGKLVDFKIAGDLLRG